jgi:hypothetical protein
MFWRMYRHSPNNQSRLEPISLGECAYTHQDIKADLSQVGLVYLTLDKVKRA